MGFRCVAAFAALLSFSVFANKEEVSPQEWAKQLVQHELTALDTNLLELHSQGKLTTAQLGQSRSVSQALRRELAGSPSESALATGSLKYLALTDFLAVAKLNADRTEFDKASAELEVAQRRADEVLELAAGVSLSNQAQFLELLQDVEVASELAQTQILIGRRQQALRGFAKQLQILAELDPTAKDTSLAASKALIASLPRYTQNEWAQAEADVARALEGVFGARLQSWDGRHLWHSLQLRILALAISKHERVSKAQAAEVLQASKELSEVTDTDTYAQRAEALVKRCAQIVPPKTAQSIWALQLQPERAQASSVWRLRELHKLVPRVREAFKKNETFLQGFQTTYNQQILSGLDRMDVELARAGIALSENAQWAVTSGFHHSGQFFQAVTMYTIEAMLDRSTAAPQYLAVWSRGLRRLNNGQPFMTATDNKILFDCLRTERREGITRAWVNRHNANILAVSALLAAEAVAVPFTGGGSAAAMPATLAMVSTATVATAKTVLLTNAALNIADRTKAKGLKGLANMDTALDALVILSLSPRPMIGGVPAKTWVGKFGQGSLTTLASLQYSTAAFLSVAGPAYGAYLYWNADVISADLQREGVAVSPSEIRRKGLVNVAMGIIAFAQNARYYRDGVAKNGDSFKKEIEPATFTGGTLKRYMSQIRQIKTVRESWANSTTTLGKIGTIGQGLGFLGMDVLLGTEGVILSYANLDSNFTNHAESVHPLPELNAGETAVILIGFEPSDYLLYAGAQAPYSNRHEIRKYGEHLYMYTYSSPEDLMRVLSNHRRKHGTVRYLKIATHGRPGRLFSPKVNTSPEAALTDGWIDRMWLGANSARLQQMSLQIFAPDARIRLWSCLVGANLDEDRGEGKDVGERFVDELGKTWLVRGGSIDASTRILMGLDATVGALFDHAIKESFRPGDRPALVLPVTPLNAGMDWHEEELVKNADPEKWGGKFAETLEFGKTMGQRLVHIYTQWPPVWWEFGVNLEGPFWQNRYRSVDFPTK